MALDFPNNPANGDTYPYTVNIVDPNDPSTILLVRDVVYTYSSAKDSWTGTITQANRIATPYPRNVVGSPPFSNANDPDAGTEGNPYKLTDQTAPTPGMTLLSSQQIIFTEQTAGQRLYFQDFSQHSSTRFQQDLVFVDGLGTAVMRLKYTDEPVTSQDGTPYIAKIKCGQTWFEWQVTQSVASPVEVGTPACEINVSGNSWTIGQTVTMTPGAIKSGTGTAPYTYQYLWQTSEDGSEWQSATFIFSSVVALTYTLTEKDIGLFIRGVTIGTDSSTPTNQVLVMNSNNSPNPIYGPPQLRQATLLRTTQSDINRYNNQTYTVFLGYSNEGLPGVPENGFQQIVFSLPTGALRYATVDSDGNVTGIVDTPPGGVKQVQLRNINIKFPVSFTDGSTPDQLLPEGTSMAVQAYASNTLGSTDVTSNSVLPELGDVVSFPTPSFIGSALPQDPDPFVASPNPFNNGVGPVGSNKTQYGLAWPSETSITFDPAWDVSATPIAQFQGGGVDGGFDDFLIIFTDSEDNDTSVVINTANSEWSAPISFSDYGNYTPPINIKRITFRSFNTSNKEVGLVGFYEADDTPVIYETIDLANARLAARKAAAIASVS